MGAASGNGFSKVADDVGVEVEAKIEAKMSRADSDHDHEK